MHPEKIPSCLDRYRNETKRILGVLEKTLAQKSADAQWLVGDKMTFADMSFVPWNARLMDLLGCSWDEVFDGLPHVQAWHNRMVALPSWVKIMRAREHLISNPGRCNGIAEGIESFVGPEA